MSTLYIAEIASLGLGARGEEVAAPTMPPLAEQTVPITNASLASRPFGGATRFVQLHCDATCSVTFGPAPVAATSNQRLAANETRFVSVTPGQAVAVIANI
jgi:hypothetical protein